MTDLGEQPSPEIEPAEPPPGGVDAVEETLYDSKPLVPDLSRLGNEGGREIPDEISDEITEPSDSDTEATRGQGGEDEQGQKESTA
ncbi:MAG TPA: hypothetical protein VHW64_18420 [Nocardioides sp.]|uniref:hypothetical protein n=1 Tax=Nocardioides sp. TaxID=35761 RepID=UPI002E2F026D|nr:hypothetical protein [Nocardioides sp.]HEX3932677.1 hypothetical protein [Nocardioides sp.]